MATPEHEVFRKNLYTISKAILPDLAVFTSKAVEKNLLATEKLDEILNPKTIETAVKLTGFLINRIEQNNSEFYEILEILQAMPTLVPIAKRLQLQIDQSTPQTPTEPRSTTPTPRSTTPTPRSTTPTPRSTTPTPRSTTPTPRSTTPTPRSTTPTPRSTTPTPTPTTTQAKSFLSKKSVLGTSQPSSSPLPLSAASLPQSSSSESAETPQQDLSTTILHDQSMHNSHGKVANATGPEWTNRSGKVAYSAGGKRDVLLIVPNNDLCHPDVVARRPAIELTQQLREKLENQGIATYQQTDDLTIMKARYGLNNRLLIREVLTHQPGGERVTRKSVLKHITSLMTYHEDRAGGVALHYIGAGKRNTGDWCFEDGFITFKDLTDLYLQLLCGRVLTIMTDCSHSGCWVKQCMTFLDEQGVGPCGHSARYKGILISVYASCLSHQVPRQLALSVHGCRNDKNTGDVIFHYMCDFVSQKAKIADAQHTRGINCTNLRCGQDSIQDECLCLPQATWQTWSTYHRIRIVPGKDEGRKAWHMVLVVDDDETILSFVEKTQGEESGKHNITCADYGQVLKAGLGEGPSNEEKASVMKPYKTCKPKPED